MQKFSGALPKGKAARNFNEISESVKREAVGYFVERARGIESLFISALRLHSNSVSLSVLATVPPHTLSHRIHTLLCLCLCFLSLSFLSSPFAYDDRFTAALVPGTDWTIEVDQKELEKLIAQKIATERSGQLALATEEMKVKSAAGVPMAGL